MGYLIRDAKCKECGETHDLFYPENEPISRNGRYMYTCPDTNEEAVYRRAGTDPVQTAKAPAGALMLERSHRQI